MPGGADDDVQVSLVVIARDQDQGESQESKCFCIRFSYPKLQQPLRLFIGSFVAKILCICNVSVRANYAAKNDPLQELQGEWVQDCGATISRW